jgi:hypothetical protein
MQHNLATSVQVMCFAQSPSQTGIPSHPLTASACLPSDATDMEALVDTAARNWGNNLVQEHNKFSWVYPSVSSDSAARNPVRPLSSEGDSRQCSSFGG